jgi:hypothetical protein
MSSGFDIEVQAAAANQEDNGTVVHIHGVDENPLFFKADSGEDKPVSITVTGVHSQRFRRIEAQHRKRKLKASRLTGETIYDENIEKVAACTVSWEGFFVNGTPVEMTPHNVKELYKRCPWVLEQVLEAMNDHARFFTN